MKNPRKLLVILGLGIWIFIFVTWLPFQVLGLVLGDIETDSLGLPTETWQFIGLLPVAVYYLAPVPCGIPAAISLGLSYWLYSRYFDKDRANN